MVRRQPTQTCPLLLLQRQSSRRSATQEAEQNSFMARLDEGLDDFFNKKVIRLGFG